MGKGEGSRAEAHAHDLSGWPEENRGGAESTVGEVKARGVREAGAVRCEPPCPIAFGRWRCLKQLRLTLHKLHRSRALLVIVRRMVDPGADRLIPHQAGVVKLQ
jgi:hypothetical protein